MLIFIFFGRLNLQFYFSDFRYFVAQFCLICGIWSDGKNSQNYILTCKTFDSETLRSKSDGSHAENSVLFVFSYALFPGIQVSSASDDFKALSFFA